MPGKSRVAQLKEAAGLTFREALPEGDATADPVVLLHGFPESSRMWEALMAELAGAGRRCVAPDLYGLGDSADAEPATFEHNLGALAAFLEVLHLGPVALIVHDWGGFVGLAWACDHPERISALVISNAGFFSDGKWHGMAEAIRGDEGEEVVEAMNREGFAALLGSFGDAFGEEDVAAYWAPYEDGRGQRATLDFYRSMDFEKLEPWQGKLAEIPAPTLLLWGADDEFAPLAGAKRLKREIPGSKLVALDGVGHFVFDEAPERSIREVASFLADARLTPRVRLEIYTDADQGLTELLETDPEVMRELGGPIDPAEIPAIHRRRMAGQDGGWWLKIVPDPAGAAIGTIGVWTSEWNEGNIHEVGWMLLPAFQGQGIASRALEMLIARTRADARFERIHAFPATANGPSNALCRRTGFSLTEEVDVAYKARPLHCNHWELDVV